MKGRSQQVLPSVFLPSSAASPALLMSRFIFRALITRLSSENEGRTPWCSTSNGCAGTSARFIWFVATSNVPTLCYYRQQTLLDHPSVQSTDKQEKRTSCWSSMIFWSDMIAFCTTPPCFQTNSVSHALAVTSTGISHAVR